MFAIRNTLRKLPVQCVTRRGMGGGGGHHHAHELHVPEFYGKLGKCCLVATYLWFFYRLKQDNGQLFGFYKPWLHEHEHEHEHLHFVDNGVDAAPTLEEHEHDEEDEDEEEEH